MQLKQIGQLWTHVTDKSSANAVLAGSSHPAAAIIRISIRSHIPLLVLSYRFGQDTHHAFILVRVSVCSVAYRLTLSIVLG
jgi:hypothetical protein